MFTVKHEIAKKTGEGWPDFEYKEVLRTSDEDYVTEWIERNLPEDYYHQYFVTEWDGHPDDYRSGRVSQTNVEIWMAGEKVMLRPRRRTVKRA